VIRDGVQASALIADFTNPDVDLGLRQRAARSTLVVPVFGPIGWPQWSLRRRATFPSTVWRTSMIDPPVGTFACPSRSVVECEKNTRPPALVEIRAVEVAP
jgi:hypothetical protein